MSFQVWHDYARLARQGFAAPLVCPDDGALYIYQADESADTPRLWCPMCGTVVTPGLRLIGEVERAVSNART